MAKASERVHVKVSRVQVHPVPEIAEAVIPAGRLSTTVIVPMVAAMEPL